MKHILWILSFWLLATQAICQKIEVDWRTTAHINHAIDVYQTITFTERGYRELNPLVQPLLKDRNYIDYVVLNVGFGLLLDDIGKRNKNLYVVWAVAEIVMVSYNRKKAGGFPVIWFKIK